MIKALAPRMRRGCFPVWFSLALAAGFPLAAQAQSPATKKAAPADKKAAAPAAAAAAAEEEAPEKPAAEELKSSTVEVFKDEKAEKAAGIFKTVSGLKAPNRNDLRSIKAMAGNPNVTVERSQIERFVSGMAYELTNKTNINALINPPEDANPRATAARAVQDATDNLLDVFHTARLAKNTAFLTEYNKVLLDILPKLFDNNLVPRVQAMIVLAQTGNPNAVPVFLAQLKNPEQTVWVKLMAARGLSNAVDNGVRVDSLSVQPTEVARAIADLLSAGDELPWPVQMRLLEALGAMRVSSMPNSVKAEMATVAMKYLTDQNARAEVRAQAAWALGMLRVNQTVKDYNYALIAYNTGQLAAELGEKIDESIEENKTLAEYLAGLLVTPIYQTFYGLDGARESGLLKVPGGNPSLAYTREVANATTALTRAAVELVRAPGGKLADRKKDLADRVSDLKGLLDKTPPKSFRLVPKGDEFRLQHAEVAKAAAPEERGGGAGGRNGR